MSGEWCIVCPSPVRDRLRLLGSMRVHSLTSSASLRSLEAGAFASDRRARAALLLSAPLGHRPLRLCVRVLHAARRRGRPRDASRAADLRGSRADRRNLRGTGRDPRALHRRRAAGASRHRAPGRAGAPANGHHTPGHDHQRQSPGRAGGAAQASGAHGGQRLGRHPRRGALSADHARRRAFARARGRPRGARTPVSK